MTNQSVKFRALNFGQESHEIKPNQDIGISFKEKDWETFLN